MTYNLKKGESEPHKDILLTDDIDAHSEDIVKIGVSDEEGFKFIYGERPDGEQVIIATTAEQLKDIVDALNLAIEWEWFDE